MIQGSLQDRIIKLLEWSRYDDAKKEVEEYIHLYPNDAMGYTILALIFQYKREYGKSLFWLSEALRRDPEHPLAWENQVITYFEMGNFWAARETLREALRLFPEESTYYYIEANIYIKNRNYKNARENMELAIEREPENALYLANYSYILSLLGNNDLSVEYERLALEKDPNHEQVFLHVAWASQCRGEMNSAQQYLEEAVRLDPGNLQIRKEYLEILQKQHFIFRLFLYPFVLFKKMHPFVRVLFWILVWIYTNPYIVIALFFLLPIAGLLISKAFVHFKVFGRVFGKSKIG